MVHSAACVVNAIENNQELCRTYLRWCRVFFTSRARCFLHQWRVFRQLEILEWRKMSSGLMLMKLDLWEVVISSKLGRLESWQWPLSLQSQSTVLGLSEAAPLWCVWGFNLRQQCLTLGEMWKTLKVSIVWVIISQTRGSCTARTGDSDSLQIYKVWTLESGCFKKTIQWLWEKNRCCEECDNLASTCSGWDNDFIKMLCSKKRRNQSVTVIQWWLKKAHLSPAGNPLVLVRMSKLALLSVASCCNFIFSRLEFKCFSQ